MRVGGQRVRATQSRNAGDEPVNARHEDGNESDDSGSAQAAPPFVDPRCVAAMLQSGNRHLERLGVREYEPDDAAPRRKRGRIGAGGAGGARGGPVHRGVLGRLPSVLMQHVVGFLSAQEALTYSVLNREHHGAGLNGRILKFKAVNGYQFLRFRKPSSPAPNLTALDCSVAKLCDRDLADIARKFPKLQVLMFRFSTVTGMGIQSLVPLRDLRVLGMEGCELSDDALASLYQLNRLQELDLTSCKGVGDEGMEKLSALISLHTLKLSCTSVTDADLLHIAKLGNLKVLDLRGCRVSEAGLARLPASLTSLRLGIECRTLEGLAHLQSLRELEFIYEGGDCLRQLPAGIGRLTLRRRSHMVTDRDLEQLHGLKALSYLALGSFDQVSDAGLTGLRLRFPGIAIVATPAASRGRPER